MIYLNCDYNEGAHPKVLERLLKVITHKNSDMAMINIA